METLFLKDIKLSELEQDEELEIFLQKKRDSSAGRQPIVMPQSSEK